MLPERATDDDDDDDDDEDEDVSNTSVGLRPDLLMILVMPPLGGELSDDAVLRLSDV